jgi:DNA-damage-inducible protein J
LFGFFKVAGAGNALGHEGPISKIDALPYRRCQSVAVLLCGPIATTIGFWRIVMSLPDTYVRSRIDADTKERAAEALRAMGLSISDAIRLLMLRVADERRLPFEIKAPNTTTRKAMAELEAGKGKTFPSVEALMADLRADH